MVNIMAIMRKRCVGKEIYMEKKTTQLACVLNATISEKGFIDLTISADTFEDISIKINDYNGKFKARAKKLAYKIYKSGK